jgi:predicted DNA binding protein
LELSAEALRPRKRQRDEDEQSPVESAIQADPDLTAQQRKALQESYRAFRELTIERRRTKGRPRS